MGNGHIDDLNADGILDGKELIEALREGLRSGNRSGIAHVLVGGTSKTNMYYMALRDHFPRMTAEEKATYFAGRINYLFTLAKIDWKYQPGDLFDGNKAAAAEAHARMPEIKAVLAKFPNGVKILPEDVREIESCSLFLNGTPCLSHSKER